jgi:hypothetical protein
MSGWWSLRCQILSHRVFGEDKYCIHFRFVIAISSTELFPVTVDVREREELDEDSQI